ncbi:MAG TPA: hypothetical protein VFG52_07790, partial [Xanthomonadales bacterium]|nr:hypothetical protein [Xanthomonadales bacterium]
MKKDSARLFGTTAVITAAIIVGAFLLDRANKTGRPLPPEQATWTELKPSTGNAPAPTPSSRNSQSEYPGSIGNPTTPTQTIPAETSAEGIIVCQHPEKGTVYTNAPSCEEVDYDNRLSQAETFQPIPNPQRYQGSDYQSPDRAAANSRTNKTKPTPNNVCDKTVLRLHGRSPPDGLNQSCKFAVGKALEIERSLAVANDPAESA